MSKQRYQFWQKCFVTIITCCLLQAAVATNKTYSTGRSLGTSRYTANKATTFIPAAPDVDAKGYILIDVNSGKVLAEKNAHKRLQPASLTKLMTLYIAFDAIKAGRIHMDDKVHISEHAWRMEGSRMFLKVNETVTVKELIQGIIVQSGNDACVALSEFIAGSEDAFTRLMNQEAKVLGMKNSHFTDCTGMPHDHHYTSPEDMAILSRSLINNFPEYYRYFAEKWFKHNGIKQPNRNRLLWRDKSVDGLKTGHTKTAGYCLVSSAKRDSMRLLTVVMGAPSDRMRTVDSQELLNYGFRFYKTHKLYQANNRIDDARIWGGNRKEIPVGLARDLYVTIPNGQYKNLRANIELIDPLKAPVTTGQDVGTLNIYLNDKPVTTSPLIALTTDKKGGIWRRMTDYFGLSIHRLFSSSQS